MKRNTKGFTLIELLIVVVIIGILAAIAIPKFAATKEKAYLATMKSDLRNLATAQEAYASSNAGAYMPAATLAPTVTVNGFAPSAAVTITLPAPVTTGWSATATHASTGKTCGIFVGGATPPTITGVTLVDGTPNCEP